MNSRLWLINDWEQRAHEARYCVKELARRCDVPVRTLRRFLSEQFGVSPGRWMRELRLRRAEKLLLGGKRINEVSDQVGYASMSQFCRAFRSYRGCSPREFVKGPPTRKRSARGGE